MIFNNDPGLEFYTSEHLYGALIEPSRMQKHVPEWFKKIPVTKNIRDQGGFPLFTAKKCLPMLDAMTLGWVIPLQSDVHVITNDDCSIIQAAGREGNQIQAVQGHAWDQIASEKWPGFKQDPLKFINHWRIKTKPGWSCLFQAMPNSVQSDFTCLSGVVDTDTYMNTINFPAVWNTPNADITLKAGTPLVQVIPFKRNKMDAKIRTATDREERKRDILEKAQGTRTGVYTQELREVR